MRDWVDQTEVLLQMKGESTSGWVYQLLDANGVIIYIGQTRRPLGLRISGHKADRAEMLACSSNFRVTSVAIEDLLGVEAETIHAYHPRFNRKCPLCSFYPRKIVGSPNRRVRKLELDQQKLVWKSKLPEVESVVRHFLQNHPHPDVSSHELVTAIKPQLSVALSDRLVAHQLAKLLGKTQTLWSPRRQKQIKGWWTEDIKKEV